MIQGPLSWFLWKIRRDGYKYDFRLLPHDFSGCYGVGSNLGFFWALSDLLFGQYSPYMFDLRSLEMGKIYPGGGV